MLFKDKEVMEKLDQLTELVNNLKTEIDDVRFDIDQILIEFDIKTPSEMTEEKLSSDDDDSEIWLPYYHNYKLTNVEVSNFGNVRNAKTKRPVGFNLNDSGKPRATFCYPGDRSGNNALVCNMVARTFIDPDLPIRSKSVKHTDGDVLNNRVDNLFVDRWATTRVKLQGPNEAIEPERRPWCGGEEIWQQYYRENFPTSVEVSNYGNVRSVLTKHPIVISPNEHGSPRFMYCWEEAGEKKSSSATVANAVASTFLDRTLPVKSQGLVHHLDENPENNHVDNLVIR